MKLLKCRHCGNLIELLEGKEVISCCNELMEELIPNTVDASVEKHAPYCNIDEDIVYVKIGENTHPMDEDHYINFLVAEYSDSIVKYIFKAGEEPEAVFDYEKGMVIYSYCNKHGLWKKEL